MSHKRDYELLKQQLATRIDSQRIITGEAERLAYGTDASFYRLIPQIVLRLKDLDEVIFTIQCCREHGIPFTFRAAGTSLSGQAVSDSVLSLSPTTGEDIPSSRKALESACSPV
ncbi:predicted D-lactate dehydrogenase [Vibrio maritimus]|uniref:Predicted D-lactate dehydrogenase n=1 Tax=Vibrio maritimus TaxID=990268 RepID=A0A090SYN7_9VIBR|nr:predicted D-lactate dehydrogenase [Vibrio maritimus]